MDDFEQQMSDSELLALKDELWATLSKTHEDERLLSFIELFLKRSDESYLEQHRMSTLPAQILHTYEWFLSEMPKRGISIRVFSPEEESCGYALDGLVIETLMPDQSFIYDTVKMLLQARGLELRNQLRLILPAEISEMDEVLSLGGGGKSPEDFGYTRWFLRDDQGELDGLEEDLFRVLERSQKVVSSFSPMTERIREFSRPLLESSEEDVLEVGHFVDWLLERHFVFMGLQVLEEGPGGDDKGFRGVFKEGLADLPGGFLIREQDLAFLNDEKEGAPLLRIRKSSSDSVVHRPGKMDVIAIKQARVAGSGQDLRQGRQAIMIWGLFTYKALSTEPAEMPVLRKNLEGLLQEEGSQVGDYDYKSLVSAYNALPVEYLLQADVDTVRSFLEVAKKAHDQQRFRSFIDLSKDRRHTHAFAILPQEDYSDELRVALQKTLEDEFGATFADHRTYLGKYGSVTLHFYLAQKKVYEGSKARIQAVKQALSELATPWGLRLRQAMEGAFGERDGAALYLRLGSHLPSSYIAKTEVSLALEDMKAVKAFLDDKHMQLRLLEAPFATQDASGDGRPHYRLRVYTSKARSLSSILSVLASFSLDIHKQNSWDFTFEPLQEGLTLHAFELSSEEDIARHQDALLRALLAVFLGQVENDAFNRLLLPAALSFEEVDVIRAYDAYLRQLGFPRTEKERIRALQEHPQFVHRLMAYFQSAFDPDAFQDPHERDLQLGLLGTELEDALRFIDDYDVDEVLSRFLGLVKATLRTNLYAKSRKESGLHYLSFKIDCRSMEGMPFPKPLYEIWVFAKQMEGMHLRFGKVARGGIRWSDRPRDFRQEVLGLVSTQQLKNAVIVPEGAKGGFVLKGSDEEGDVSQRELADFYYGIFIRGLLDLTDNLEAQVPVHPEGVICKDDHDPYLVVAADKGTAHLSDTANQIAESYGYWLGDAFASGGSHGYDHKVLGITARGVWEGIKRHFYEKGLDPYVAPLTVVGIGDMSGDVFGNGLLESKSLLLIGAFNHQHIFFDPKPKDALLSWKERKRLFELKQSTWLDYDKDLISEGGGVFERRAKRISLSKAAQDCLGVEMEECSGETLVKLLLMAPVDLLYNGGIGTYIKASSESHDDVRDSSNDRVRVNADELRCQVIGEGGNLGMTQLARQQFAMLGGALNTDAIDNSGGVDLSDHEVNIKTLLQIPLSKGELSLDDRNRLISEASMEVTALVLADNRGQTLAVSLDEERSHRDLWLFFESLSLLKKEHGFSPYEDPLPDSHAQIEERLERGQALLRPELSKLLLYSKMSLYQSLMAHQDMGITGKEDFVSAYFPSSVKTAYPELLEKHFLFQEIAATAMCNHLVNHAGISLVPSLEAMTEKPPEAIAKAWFLAEKALSARSLRESLHQAKLSAKSLYSALLKVEDALHELSLSLLWLDEGEALDALYAGKDRYAHLSKMLQHLLEKGLEGGRSSLEEKRVKEAKTLKELGLKQDLALVLSRLSLLPHALWMSQLSFEDGISLEEAARLYLEAGERLGLFALLERLEGISWDERWDMIASSPLKRRLYTLMHFLSKLFLQKGPGLFELPALLSFKAQLEEALAGKMSISSLLVFIERLEKRLMPLAS